MKRYSVQCLILLLSVLAVSSTSLAAQVTYQVIPLGTMPGIDSSRALSINNSGLVIGNSYSANKYVGSFAWDPANGMREIDVPEGVSLGGVDTVNDAGQILGGTSANHDTDFARAFIMQGDSIAMLPSLDGYCTWGHDINDNGVVVGTSLAGDILPRPFVYDNSGMRELPTPTDNDWSEANAINNNGLIGGTVNRRAYVWYQDGTGRDLGTLPGYTYECYISSINSSGVAVGTSSDSNGHSRALIWRGGGILDLFGTSFTNNSSANDINDLGQVVGHLSVWSPSHNYYLSRPFLWDQTNGVCELPLLPGYTNGTAWSINESGWIAGFCYSNDLSLKPTAVVWAPVPEPSSVAALLTGCIALGGLIRRRR